MAGYRSFIFPDALVSADSVTLDSRESHHLVRVLRARVGEPIELLDGKGGRFHGEIRKADAKGAEIAVSQAEHIDPAGLELTLVQALPKGKTMDLILRIATEIGVSRVQPVFTDQGEVQIKGERLSSKIDKWRTTMVESCKQCGLPFLPALEAPTDLRDWLAGERVGADDMRLVASLEGEPRLLRERLKSIDPVRSITVAVGPEGDFSSGEYAALREAGFQSVRLGRNVLRAETAAAYILSVVDQVLVQKEEK